MKKLFRLVPIALFGICLVFNSCSEEENIRKINPKLDVEFHGLLTNLHAVEAMSIGASNLKSSMTDHVYLSKDVSTTCGENNSNSSINNLQDLINLKNEYNLYVTDSLIPTNELLSIYAVSEQQVVQYLQPTIQEAKNFFYSKGFNDFEINEMLDGEEEYTLIPIVMEIQRQANNYNNMGPFAKGAIRDCFLETTGIAAGVALVSALTAYTFDKTLVMNLMKKALKKIGSRVLGGIGLALMVMDFSWCVANYD